MGRTFALVTAVAVSAGCSVEGDGVMGGAPPGAAGGVPGIGAPTTPASAQTLVAREPISRLGAVYVNGFHVAADDPSLQMEANHYCSKVASSMYECALFDQFARLFG